MFVPPVLTHQNSSYCSAACHQANFSKCTYNDMSNKIKNSPVEQTWKNPNMHSWSSKIYPVNVMTLTITNWHNWKICENSEHMVSFKCFAFVCVIWPLEKSNTSSLRSLRIAILFWQRLSFVLLAPTMSGINDSQFLGHSRFNT